jgi:hypothetical protein
VKFPVLLRAYLELYATCCRVANLSEAGEYIDTILSEMGDIQVLSQDGAFAEALQYALWPWSQEISVPLRMVPISTVSLYNLHEI